MRLDSIEISGIMDAPDNVVCTETLADKLNLSIERVINLAKMPIRSILTALIEMIDSPQYGQIIQVAVKPNLNPLQIITYISLNRIISFDKETRELLEYNQANLALQTAFGDFSFSIDISELEVLVNLERLPMALEETTIGRAIGCHIYDAYSKLDSISNYDEEVIAAVTKWLKHCRI